jgi:hypothetical protein
MKTLMRCCLFLFLNEVEKLIFGGGIMRRRNEYGRIGSGSERTGGGVTDLT